MGQYLAVGLRLKASVRKEKQLDGKSVEEILGKVEDKYNLSEIYERREEETYYEYSIKKEVLDKELVPLIEKFYALRYTKGERTDAANVIETLKALPDTSARLELLNDRRYQTYQAGNDMDYFYIDVFPPMEIRVCSYNVILSIDGKIAMECYGRAFDFFSRCIAAQLQEFALSKALTVWIDG
ncbi:hypothetical protein [Prevotella sp.]|uniref:hypothetical protein n=1 Tax=Prevotella sp. TaxID=59823 RepID=UPI00307995CB